MHSSVSVRKCKKYFLIDATTKIYFNADFDSGNLEKVEQLSPYIVNMQDRLSIDYTQDLIE